MKDSMYQLRKKLDQLLVISTQKVDYTKMGTYPNDPLSLKMRKQEELFDELKALAKENDTLLGRVVKFPYADSYAMYVVTKVNKSTVRVTWVDWCDGWMDDRLGAEGTLDLEYVQQKITGEDKLAELFSKN